MRKRLLICLGLILPLISTSQKPAEAGPNTVSALVQKYKTLQRGPYRGLAWYCADGEVYDLPETCPEKNEKNVQRGRYTKEVIALGDSMHIFLGQILSTTNKTHFWDAENYNSRLKQYLLERYLRRIDDGWVLRKAQFYRGAIQIEDEKKWGQDFLEWCLRKNEVVKNQFFLMREAARDIPHGKDDQLTLDIRALSKTLGDNYSAFMGMRAKIHGQPEKADIQATKDFREKHKSKMGAQDLKRLDELILKMENAYQPIDLKDLRYYIDQFQEGLLNRKTLTKLMEYAEENEEVRNNPEKRIRAVAAAMVLLREQIFEHKWGQYRLAALDASISLEELIYREADAWKPQTLRGIQQKIKTLCQAAYGCGYLEAWEWRLLSKRLEPRAGDEISLQELIEYKEDGTRLVDWGSGMIRGVFQNAVEHYGDFEPMAYGLNGEKVRSGLLLPLGKTISRLGDFVAKQANFSNIAPGLPDPSLLRGTNPGFAKGELVVIDGQAPDLQVDEDKIYVFRHPPADLKPVAGVLSVSEGNRVSHLQLLATNLGIPNASISHAQLKAMKPLEGKEIFFAVSHKGTVIFKEAKAMTKEEQGLFKRGARKEEKVAVPLDKLDLELRSVVNMRSVNSSDAGRICGPKAANLGALKTMFPEHVVEGLVIPFGIFRSHMDQKMPGKGQSYWGFLTSTFEKANAMEKAGKGKEQVDAFVLGQLAVLRQELKKMNLDRAFVKELNDCFLDAFGKPAGKVPVFVRSDTNMEDLKEFTGAGLNKTVFNVVDFDEILQGIRDVWASPYRERGYRWRQAFLSNPENVFPSILIIPSVDVEKSGVLITKGIASGRYDELTVAFSRGAGGAVEGQSAETWILRGDGTNILNSPAREAFYRRLPITGGTSKHMATFEEAILDNSDLAQLRGLAAAVQTHFFQPDYQAKFVGPVRPKLQALGSPYDIELGFKDGKFWLFQIRPYVENKRAGASQYLQSISPEIPASKTVELDSKL